MVQHISVFDPFKPGFPEFIYIPPPEVGGTGNAIVLTLPFNTGPYREGDQYIFIARATSTDLVTVAIEGYAAKELHDGAQQVGAGEIIAGLAYHIIYENNIFVLREFPDSGDGGDNTFVDNNIYINGDAIWVPPPRVVHVGNNIHLSPIITDDSDPADHLDAQGDQYLFVAEADSTGPVTIQVYQDAPKLFVEELSLIHI